MRSFIAIPSAKYGTPLDMGEGRSRRTDGADRRSGTVLLALLGLVLSSTGGHSEPARAQSFVDSVGVNIHTMYTDGGYKFLDKIQTSVSYLGIVNVRDAAPGGDALAQSRYSTLAEAGLRYDFIVESDPPGTISRIGNFAAAHPGSVAAIEGPNEINNWPVAFNGMKGREAADAFQIALYKAVRSDARLDGVKTFNFDDNPPPPGAADDYNAHPYPKHGAQPFAVFAGIAAHAAQVAPGLPTVLTEVGYNALPDPKAWQGRNEWAPVDEPTQAILTANLLLDAFALGMPHTYVYALLDAYPDPKTNDADKHVGLFDLRYRPKPAAVAIHNLTAILTDPDPHSSDFALRPLKLALDGLPDTAHVLEFEKANGLDIIAIWNELPIWSGDAPEKPKETSIVLSCNGRGAAVYDPLHSVEPTQEVAHATRISLRLGAQPIVVVLSP